ncbi:MAG: GNAT family N-acetyltransferase [Rhodobacteraceae bacterium]|nr:GNAT family N-acetyltransferase [Paracoccaceae bacterium]
MVTRTQYRDVAELHASAINQGFLPTLGIPFLSFLYETIDCTDGSALFVYRQNSKIVGFIAGSTDIKLVYRAMTRKWWQLALTLLPALASPSKLYRIIEILLHSRDSKWPEVALPSAELLSISVAKEFRGNHTADLLFGQLVEYFRSRGVKKFKIVVGAALASAHRFYQRMGAEALLTVEVHRGANSVIYICDVR